MSDIDDCIDASELVDRWVWPGRLTREMKWEKLERARLELAQLRRAVEARDQALLDALRTWSFDDGQQHTHSWHDRQDWIERHRAILAEIDGKDGERG